MNPSKEQFRNAKDKRIYKVLIHQTFIHNNISIFHTSYQFFVIHRKQERFRFNGAAFLLLAFL